MEESQHRRKPRTDKGLLRAEQQRLQALQLRQAGATYTQIGQELGYTRQHAFYLVSTALARIKAQTEETAEQMLALDLDRLDALLLGIWHMALDGNLLAIDRVLKILDQRARYLDLYGETAALEQLGQGLIGLVHRTRESHTNGQRPVPDAPERLC
jgi:hypothetical protein